MENPSSSTKRQRINENGAFDQVAPSSASAYAPSPSTQSKLLYDVFINHRGPDVKHTLAKDIYDKLSSMGVQVFLDESVLEPGDSLTTEIEEAMKNASLHVAIFSKNYADSPWCLAELSYMVTTGVEIVPVFYEVEPFHLRWLDKEGGFYADSFAQHKTKGRYTAEKLKEWKEALQRVSYKYGYLLKDDKWEWVLEGLANRVRAMRRAQVAGPTNAFGLKESVEEIEEILQGVESESVPIVGIVGMGGCGKTTLARELFNSKLSSFPRCSFLNDVRDRAGKKQLPGLQNKLLEDLRVNCSQFESIEEGKEHLARYLRSLRALIVLDDVDSKEQIDSLLLEKDRPESGSLIIITTRDEEVLTSWGIRGRSIYRMKGLSSCHAKKLFCVHAFQKPEAPDGFEDLVERAIQSCQGLPLSLKIFGGQLCSKRKDYWESQLNEISRVLPKEILTRLKISYDALDSEEQDLFLDVSCFFIGEEKSLVLQLWDALGRSVVYSWETLQNKCLVELDENNRIRMHDHLRDLGREIASKKLPARIWFENQINIIQTEAKESMQVRGIMAATIRTFSWPCAYCSSHYRPPFEECVEVMGSSNPKDAISLKYLVFNYTDVPAKIGELSRGLVWLRCFNFNHANLSSCFSLKSLRVLQLYGAKGLETIWENSADAPLQLRELIVENIEVGSNLQRFLPSIELLKYLKKIVISMFSMTSLPNEFCNLNSLEYLQLHTCPMLSSLPISFGNLRNLTDLYLKFCSRIRTLPDSFEQLTNLRNLHIQECRELTFNSENSSILQNIRKLESLRISGCKLEIWPCHIANQPYMRELHISIPVSNLPANIGDLSSLRRLYISSCHNLKSLPPSVGRLNALEELVIWMLGVESLPETFGQLSNLRELRIEACPILTSLPDTFGDLSSLRKLNICCKNFKSLPATVGRLNALEELVIEESGVESLPETFGQLANLRELRIGACPIRELAFGSSSKASLNKLRQIRLDGTHLTTISISEDCCPSLETLDIFCPSQCLTRIETLPKTLKQLTLIQLSQDVDALASFAHLTSLKELELEVSAKVKKVEGLEYLRALETLKVRSKWEVPGIQSLEQMQRLETLELSANNFAALEPCIRTMKKWPSKVQVWARAMDGVASNVESIVNDFPFGTIDSVTEESDKWTLTPPHIQSSDAAIVCFVIQGNEFHILTSEECYVQLESTSKEADRVVWISVCDSSTIANKYSIYLDPYYGTVKRKRGTLVVGGKKCIIEAFKKLVVLLKG